MKNQVVIIVISHKPVLNKFELRSLRQLYKILGLYPIRFVCPEKLDISNYRDINRDIVFDFIDPEWLRTYENFNKLKISPFLYQRYIQYEFILFYEPDAYVFSNNLEYWCKQGYDYIGAPLPVELIKTMKDRFNVFLTLKDLVFPDFIGNGGFSLRKTKTHINLLTVENKLANELMDNGISNEDLIINILLYNRRFKLPKIEVAALFALELLPERFIGNSNGLPMGCHAWYKSKELYSFWEKWIDPISFYKMRLKYYIKKYLYVWRYIK